MAKKTEAKAKATKSRPEEAGTEVLIEEQEGTSENLQGEGKNTETPDGQKGEQSADQIIAALQAELAQTKQALEVSEEYNLRLNADFINFRKRKEKEMAELVKFANQDLLTQLLPILDNFERTLSAIEKTDNLTAIKEGIASVTKSMQHTLGRIGLEPIEAVGQPFDSELHEAITTIPAPDESQEGMVVDEIEKGYKLKDKVIRFSKVIVGE